MSPACPALGFSIELLVRPGSGEHGTTRLWQAFVNEVIEPRGLACGGRHDGDRWSNVVRGEAGQATDADREAVRAWIAGRPEIVSAEVGPLVDLTGSM